MSHYLTPRQPSFLLTSMLGLGVALLLPALPSQLIERAAAETSLAIGDKISTPEALSQIPDGYHQLCSEPEPEQFFGAGTCYWFNKVGDELIGYYGIPHSDIFIDCISGRIENETVVGQAIAVSWEGAPLAQLKSEKALTTWKTLTLRSGKIEYESKDDRGAVSVINFNEAILSLQNYYRYSPEKVALMNTPPSSCSVKAWIDQVASL